MPPRACACWPDWLGGWGPALLALCRCRVAATSTARLVVSTSLCTPTVNAIWRVAHGALKPSPAPVPCSLTHHPSRPPSPPPSRAVYFFDYGVVACWGLAADQERVLVASLAGQAAQDVFARDAMEVDQVGGGGSGWGAGVKGGRLCACLSGEGSMYVCVCRGKTWKVRWPICHWMYEFP